MKNKKGFISGLLCKLWFNIFLRVVAIFAVFVIALTVANSSFLTEFYCYKQKKELVRQTQRVAGLDMSNRNEVTSLLRDISDNNNSEVEIYDDRGIVLYTTQGSQLMDFFSVGNDKFSMAHEEFEIKNRKFLDDGCVYEEAVSRFDKGEYMICKKKTADGLTAEVRVKRQIIESSATVANEFVIIVAVICFVISVIWVLLFARKFSKPLTEMNEITADMAKLEFCRKLQIDRTDEIGQLAVSINEMSASLSESLCSLKEANAKLRDEIELERSLDKMRREFVADVSHELKTPISIISGYAEGLKLNINAKSREEYCDTIIDESARMNKLVLSILELSRYESGQIPIKMEPFDISQLASKMAETIIKKDKTVSVNMPETLTVFADELQIEQVLKSYLENADSHTESGGKITVFSESHGETVRICVHNTGEKISEDMMPDIWQSFYRGDTSHKREQNRFGLGLSIVYAIMRMHSQNCGVYNTDDGVCFWFEVKKNGI